MRQTPELKHLKNQNQNQPKTNKQKITLSKPFNLKIQDQITWGMFCTGADLKVTLSWYWEHQGNEL